MRCRRLIIASYKFTVPSIGDVFWITIGKGDAASETERNQSLVPVRSIK